MNRQEDEGTRATSVGTAGPWVPSPSGDFLPDLVPGALRTASDPLPWRTMSRAECMQLAIALERALAARRVRSSG